MMVLDAVDGIDDANMAGLDALQRRSERPDIEELRNEIAQLRTELESAR